MNHRLSWFWSHGYSSYVCWRKFDMQRQKTDEFTRSKKAMTGDTFWKKMFSLNFASFYETVSNDVTASQNYHWKQSNYLKNRHKIYIDQNKHKLLCSRNTISSEPSDIPLHWSLHQRKTSVVFKQFSSFTGISNDCFSNSS